MPFRLRTTIPARYVQRAAPQAWPSQHMAASHVLPLGTHAPRPAALLGGHASSSGHRPTTTTACRALQEHHDSESTAPSTSYADSTPAGGPSSGRRPLDRPGSMTQQRQHPRQQWQQRQPQQQQQDRQQDRRQQYQQNFQQDRNQDRQHHPQHQYHDRRRHGIPGAQRRQRALAELRQQLLATRQSTPVNGRTLNTDAAVQGPQSQEEYELVTGLSVTWLGTSSGNPTPARNVSCTVVRVPGALYLVDVGEGSVRQLLEAGYSFKDVDRIFVTHLHGDHCFGIGSMLRKVTQARVEALGPDCPPLYVFGPPALAELVLSSLYPPGVKAPLPTKVVVTEFVGSPDRAQAPEPMEPTNSLFYATMAPSAAPSVPALQDTSHLTPAAQQLQSRLPRWPRDPATNATPGQAWFMRCDNGVTVAAAQLQHRIPCWGYVFQEAPTKDLPRQRKVVILGDTMDSTAMAPLAYGADLVAHEATFSEGMEDKARIAQHSTGWMAGLFAARVKARHLVLTHFSARYDAGRAPLKPKAGKGEDGELSAEEEAAAQNWAVQQLVAEARSTYGSGSISAAQDFLTIHIPRPQRPPFTNMQGVLQWVAMAEMARLALPHVAAVAALASAS